jgi:hypothetical protein
MLAVVRILRRNNVPLRIIARVLGISEVHASRLVRRVKAECAP